jgi:hypothetical protein
MNDDSEGVGALRAFRGQFYGCLRQRADALFELTDSLLTAGTVSSPVHLSLELVHRRGWGSLYAALLALSYAPGYVSPVSLSVNGERVVFVLVLVFALFPFAASLY